jgi:hypothetical protein
MDGAGVRRTLPMITKDQISRKHLVFNYLQLMKINANVLEQDLDRFQ